MHLPSRVLVVASVGLAAAVLAACGDGGSEPEAAGTTTTAVAGTVSTAAGEEGVVLGVEVRDGAVVGGVERAEVPLGSPVRLEVSSDVADHVHVHGYDLFADVTPDEPGVVEFRADIPGVFEVELEDRGLALLELLVR